MRAVVLSCAGAAVTVAGDAYFSAQQGYLARPMDYDGVSYVSSAHAVVLVIRSLHLRTALHDIANAVSPLWVGLLTAQQLVLGTGALQAFLARFWAVGFLLLLVYWIVSRRSNARLGAAAAVVTALLPLVSPAVRASFVELVTGQANYVEHGYLDDLRPDLLTVVFVLWSVAALVEHSDAPRRSGYVASALFAAAAVLSKSSTAPVVLVAWGAALGFTWFATRRSSQVTRESLLGIALFVAVLLPWAVFAHGVETVVTYLKGITAFSGAYASGGGVVGGLTYFPSRIPIQLGPILGWIVAAGALYLLVMLARGKLRAPEVAYAGTVLLFYLAFSLPSSKNPVLGVWLSLSFWTFFVAGAARMVREMRPLEPGSSVALSVAGVYVLAAYGLGLFALAGWPAIETSANAQLRMVTSEVAQELGRHVTAGQCFAYAPGPGWPTSLTDQLMDADGQTPFSTPIDIDPSHTTISQYVAEASSCPAALVYEQDISDVAHVFFAPATRQPYLRAVAEWVRSPLSGFRLDRSWTFVDLPPGGPHALGHYQGISLTIDLYVRG